MKREKNAAGQTLCVDCRTTKDVLISTGRCRSCEYEREIEAKRLPKATA